MRYLQIVGLVFATVLALSAVSAASASATEFKTVAFPMSFSGKGGAGDLTTAGHKPIECEKSTSKGEVAGAKLANKIEVKYEKCSTVEGFRVECENEGAGTGNIKTKVIQAEPVDLGGAGTAPVGLELKPESGTEFAKFTCGGVSVTVSNSVICESKGASVGKLATTGELVCAQQSAGIQNWRKANGNSTELLLSAEIAGKPENAAINTSEVLTFTKEIEQTTP